jgi:hypothetical protein
MGDRRSAYRVLMETRDGKIPLGILGVRWEDNIKRNLQEEEWGNGGMGWIDLAQDRDRCWTLVNAIMNLWLP